MELKNRESSQWWWLHGHNNGDANRSSWLQSTLADLDEKTKTMLKIIEGDADSFAQRAEIYYNKRPELVTMVEDFYRTHRSLAEKYDHQVKSEPVSRVLTPWSSPLSFTKYHLDKSLSLDDKMYDSYSEAYGPEESDESEVDEPKEVEKEQKMEIHIKSKIPEESSAAANEELIRLREEVEKLRGENRFQEKQLAEKDEEKREVIRQLSIAMDLLREENEKLKKCLARNNTPKKEKQSKGDFLGRLFDGFGISRANLVAL